KSDLVWQHTSDGLVEIQFLNGAVAVGGGLIANNPFGLGWRVVGAADSNGDGKPDLVYRRISDGLTELDLLNGTTIIGGGIAGARLGPNQPDTPAVTGLQPVPGDTSSGTQNTLAMPQNGQDNLNLIYQQVLGREPDSGGFATYQALLDSGADLSNVRSIIAHSAEAQMDLVRLFGGILNRDPNAAELMGAENRLADGASLQDLQDGLIADGGAGGFTIVGVPNGDATVASASGPT